MLLRLLRLLRPQGVAGVAAALCLALLLLLQKGETRHWRKQSAGFEKLYQNEQSARLAAIANYRAAADAARAADDARIARVSAEQRGINQRIEDEFESRIAAARAAAQRLLGPTGAAADPGAGGNASLPVAATPAATAHQAAAENRLPQADALIATEQAIQLDALIKWVNAQALVDVKDSAQER